jgi:hypothetical protein
MINFEHVFFAQQIRMYDEKQNAPRIFLWI